MKHCDTLIAPRWCVPVQPAGRVLEEHAVALDDGRIIDILPRADALQKYQPSVTVERPDHALLPGFVNTHTHAAMTLLRGISDDLPLQRWLTEGIWPVEKRWVSAEMVRDGTELAIAEMLRGGTTCFCDQYFFPEVVAATANDAHMRANIGTPIIEFPTAWANNVSEYLSKASDLVHDRFADHPLISTSFAPHSSAALTDDSFRDLRVIADQLDIRVQIHLHETLGEIERAVAETGKRPFARLADLGLVNRSLIAVHAVHMNDEEIALMADRGVSVAHCPKSNLKLASGIAPVTSYRDAGVHVAIGTDSAASNNSLDMLSEIQTAALLARARSNSADALTAADALRFGTLDGAAALGLENEIGSIERGKAADLISIDLAQINTQPVYDPISAIAFAARADQVRDVWIAGRHLLENGELTHMNVARILARSHEWRNRIATQTGRPNE